MRTNTPTLADRMREWLDYRTVRDIKNEESRFRVHILPSPLGRIPIDQVRAIDVRRFVKELSQKKSEQTVRHCLRQIKQVFEEAHEEGLCAANPAFNISVPKQTRTEDPWTYLQPFEIEAIHSSPDLTVLERRAALLAIYTGLRLGELKHLHWRDVHIGGDTPHIVVRYSNGRATKSGKPGRTPLLPMAAHILQEMAAERPPEPFSDLVFFNANTGRAFSDSYDFRWADFENNAGAIVKGAKSRAGIDRDVRFHDLRHTAAAALVSGYWGEPWTTEEVKEFMRHSNITITQRYSHLDPKGLFAKAASMTGKNRLTSNTAEVIYSFR